MVFAPSVQVYLARQQQQRRGVHLDTAGLYSFQRSKRRSVSRAGRAAVGLHLLAEHQGFEPVHGTATWIPTAIPRGSASTASPSSSSIRHPLELSRVGNRTRITRPRTGSAGVFRSIRNRTGKTFCIARTRTAKMISQHLSPLRTSFAGTFHAEFQGSVSKL